MICSASLDIELSVLILFSTIKLLHFKHHYTRVFVIKPNQTCEKFEGQSFYVGSTTSYCSSRKVMIVRINLDVNLIEYQYSFMDNFDNSTVNTVTCIPFEGESKRIQMRRKSSLSKAVQSLPKGEFGQYSFLREIVDKIMTLMLDKRLIPWFPCYIFLKLSPRCQYTGTLFFQIWQIIPFNYFSSVKLRTIHFNDTDPTFPIAFLSTDSQIFMFKQEAICRIVISKKNVHSYVHSCVKRLFKGKYDEIYAEGGANFSYSYFGNFSSMRDVLMKNVIPGTSLFIFPLNKFELCLYRRLSSGWFGNYWKDGKGFFLKEPSIMIYQRLIHKRIKDNPFERLRPLGLMNLIAFSILLIVLTCFSKCNRCKKRVVSTGGKLYGKKV
ncbi:hypothetical protein SNEBB_004309 [Seison nebaliae]|nr:hypothetical protein SNEBB_004309 [Seison nebaliae]